MKKSLALLCALFISLTIFAQKPAISWGDEFRMRKGSTSLDVICSDKTGVYLQEGHLAMKSYFVIGASARSSARLVKLDRNFSEIFSSDFNKELKGKEFMQFFALNDKMFIVANDYVKSDRTFLIYGAEVSKETGELKSSWKQLGSVAMNEKKDQVDFKISYTADSSRMVIVSSLKGKSNTVYRVKEVDDQLKSMGKETVINNDFDPVMYDLEDLVYTDNKRVILVGRVYEYREGKKKKSKFLDFANYNIRLYDETGKQIKELNTTVNGKWLTSTKLVQGQDKKLLLAAFYSNDKKKRNIDGILLQRIDPVTGEVLFTSDKHIDYSMLNPTVDESVEEDASESKQERKEREKLESIKNEGEAFSTYMRFNNIYTTSDGGIVVLAEKQNQYTYTTTVYTSGVNGAAGQTQRQTYTVYEYGDLLMYRVNPDRNIDWIKVIPKFQKEVIPGGAGYYSGFFTLSFFDNDIRPYYSGVGSMQSGDLIYLFFNDNPRNAAVLQPGQKVKMASRFGKSDCYTLTMDALTGNCKRDFFFSNRDIPTSMPRHSSIIGNDMYIIGKEDRMLGKSKIVVGKITLKR